MESEQPLHTEAMLLPGYVNQSLSSEEQQQVAQHLKACATCQEELQEITKMQTAIKASIEDRQGPSPAAFATLMQRIEQEKQFSQQQTPETTGIPWWETVESTFRSLFEVQWIPALASVLIVGQAFLLFSLIGTQEGQRGQVTRPIIERGIPQGVTPQASSLKITVTFQPDAQEQHIREFLQTIQGRIIDGPSSKGIYTLAFPQQNIVTLDALREKLLLHPDLIRSADPHRP